MYTNGYRIAAKGFRGKPSRVLVYRAIVVPPALNRKLCLGLGHYIPLIRQSLLRVLERYLAMQAATVTLLLHDAPDTTNFVAGHITGLAVFGVGI